MNKTKAFDLSGRVALVTGASGGLGAHFARVLADNGAKVIVGARREDRLVELVQSIRSEGGRAAAVAMDVTDTKSVRQAFEFATSEFGVVDMVSNNAGVADAKLALDVDDTGWNRVMETNVHGVRRVAVEAAARLVAAGKSGSIVNTASILGLRVSMAQSSYATSKAAVIQLTRCLALEWSRHGIRVNALCPGYFRTEMTDAYLDSDHGKKMIAKSPAARMGDLDELSAPFLLLASDAGSFINGVALPVDGAHSIGIMI